MRYQNVGGPHQLLSGEVVLKNGFFESDDPELLTKFKNKFKKVEPVEALAAPVAALAAPTEPTATDSKASGPSAGPAAPVEAKKEPKPIAPVMEGQDLTKDFPVAKNNALKVYKVKDGFNVFDGDVNPINEAPLPKRQDVDKFIAFYLKD